MNKNKLILRAITKKDRDNFRKKKVKFEDFAAAFKQKFKPYEKLINISNDDLKEIYKNIMEVK